MSQILKRTTFKATNSHQLSIVVVPIITGVLATLCVVLRFRARRIQKQRCMLDDWLALAALLLTWIFQAVNLTTVFAGGAGLPIETVMAIDPNAVGVYLQVLMANFTLWMITVTVVQLSILFFYIRIFGINTVFKWICFLMVFLVTGFGVAGFFSALLACNPVSKSWNPDPTAPGTCVDTTSSCTAVGIIHVLFDLSIVIIPMPLIWKLQASFRNKVVLSILLCLGLIATVISLLKITCLFNLTGIPPSDVTDYLWLCILLQTLELPIGIICCCVPSLRPVMVNFIPTLQSMASSLLSFTRRSTSVNRSYGAWSEVDTGKTESTTGFTRLGSSAVKVGAGDSAARKSDDAAAAIELDRLTKAKSDQNAISVSNSYTVSRE